MLSVNYWHTVMSVVHPSVRPSSKLLGQFQPNLKGMFHGRSFLKIAKRNQIHEELWLPCQPIEKTQDKINSWSDFKIILQK